MHLLFPKPALFLARHGQTQWNQSGLLQGQLDSQLTAAGRQQSRQLALQLATAEIDQVVCSDLNRAKQTAAICAGLLDCPIQIDAGLNEQNFGDWQGLSIDWLIKNTGYQAAACAPNGESNIEVANRMQHTVSTILKRYSGQNILLIGHGTALKHYFTEYLTGFDLAKAVPENGQVYKFSYCRRVHNLIRIKKMSGQAA